MQTVAAWAFVVLLVFACVGWWQRGTEERAARRYLARKEREKRGPQ